MSRRYWDGSTGVIKGQILPLDGNCMFGTLAIITTLNDDGPFTHVPEKLGSDKRANWSNYEDAVRQGVAL